MTDDERYDLEDVAAEFGVDLDEEPDCAACNDMGCRSCDTTRWDLWRSSVCWWFRRWFSRPF